VNRRDFADASVSPIELLNPPGRVIVALFIFTASDEFPVISFIEGGGGGKLDGERNERSAFRDFNN